MSEPDLTAPSPRALHWLLGQQSRSLAQTLGGVPLTGDAGLRAPIMPITALLVALSAMAAWLSATHVLTADAYSHLLAGRVQASEMSKFVSRFTNMSLVGYAAEPALVLGRITLLALTVQLALLGAGFSRSFRAVYLVSAVAYVATIAKGLAHLAILARLGPSGITMRALATSPLSLASGWGSAAWEHSMASYALLDGVNVFEIAWCAIVATGLVKLKVPIRVAFPLALLMSVAIAAVQVSATGYLSGMFR